MDVEVEVDAMWEITLPAYLQLQTTWHIAIAIADIAIGCNRYLAFAPQQYSTVRTRRTILRIDTLLLCIS